MHRFIIAMSCYLFSYSCFAQDSTSSDFPVWKRQIQKLTHNIYGLKCKDCSDDQKSFMAPGDSKFVFKTDPSKEDETVLFYFNDINDDDVHQNDRKKLVAEKTVYHVPKDAKSTSLLFTEGSYFPATTLFETGIIAVPFKYYFESGSFTASPSLLFHAGIGKENRYGVSLKYFAAAGGAGITEDINSSTEMNFAFSFALGVRIKFSEKTTNSLFTLAGYDSGAGRDSAWVSLGFKAIDF